MSHPNNRCYSIFYHDSGLKIWGIEEAYFVNIYLVEGEDRALVIDTGRGIGNLHEFIRTLTDKPLTVVNTHNHYDHTWGNGTFGEVYMLDVEINVPRPKIKLSADQKRRYKLGRLDPKDERPYNYSTDCLTDWPDVPVLPIGDGYVFELGNRPIEVIHTEGHTMGSICLLDRKARILFTGDTANDGVLLGGSPEIYVFKHRATMDKLLTRKDEFNFLMLGHGTYQAKIDQIRDIISAEQDILDGTAVCRPCDMGWPAECLYTKGRITVGFDHDKIHAAKTTAE